MARIAVMLSISPEMINAIDRIAHLDRRTRQDVIRTALEIALPGMTQGVPPLEDDGASNDAVDGRTARYVGSPVRVARCKLALALAEEAARVPSVVPAQQEIQRLRVEVCREALAEAMGGSWPGAAEARRLWPGLCPVCGAAQSGKECTVCGGKGEGDPPSTAPAKENEKKS